MNETLTPGRMADRLQGKIDLDPGTTGKLSTELFSIISRELKKEDSISLFGFGTFKRIPVPISKGRNPQTGEEIIIPAHFRIKFSPSAKVAERINAEYAHLKPVILQEEKQHEGLLMKAERYVLSINADPEPPAFNDLTEYNEEAFVIPTAVPLTEFETDTESSAVQTESFSAQIEEKIISEQRDDSNTEPDFGFEKDRKASSQKKNLMLLGGLVLLLGMGWIILDRNSNDEVTGISINHEAVQALEKPETPVKPQPAPEPAVAAEPVEQVPSPPPSPPTESEVPVETEYSIVEGDSFSLLARDKWGSIHLWPYLYDRNKDLFSDPDLIRTGDKIIFPEKPDIGKDKDKIEKSIMAAYRRYMTLIKERPDSPRNLNREISAGYVLLGGDILYPGFTENNKDSIRIEDIRRVEELKR